MPLLAAVPVLLWSFAVDDGGFTPAAGGVQWAWAVPATGPGGGDTVWGTNPAGNYFNDASDELEVPLPDLAGVDHPVITVRHWYDIQAGDEARFEVNDGAGWVNLDPIFGYPSGAGFTGSSGGWVVSSLDLRAFGPTPRVRFAFSADGSVSAAGWYLSDVGLYDGDVTAPAISPVVVPGDTEVFSGTYPVQVLVLDDTAVAAVTLNYSVNATAMGAVSMSPVGGGIWEGQIPAQSHRSVVSWNVVADDGGQTSTWPELGMSSFVVELMRPSDFAAVDDGTRKVGNQVDFAWTAPATQHPYDGYWIRAVEVLGTARTVVDTWWVAGDRSEATIALVPDGPRTFDLVADYAALGTSEPTATVDVQIEEAALTRIDPPFAYQGDVVWVRIEGENLYLDPGDSLIFDGGIDAGPLQIETINDAAALVEVPRNAVTGDYGITVNTQWGSYRFNDVFSVRSGDDAPRIVEVSPSTVRQGDAATVEIQASEAFAGPVAIDVDEDVLVVEDPVVEGPLLTLEIVVSGGARPGLHTLILDDGSRLWEADLVVEERVYTGNTGCGGCNGAADGPPFAAWWLLFLVARRRP